MAERKMFLVTQKVKNSWGSDSSFVANQSIAMLQLPSATESLVNILFEAPGSRVKLCPLKLRKWQRS